MSRYATGCKQGQGAGEYRACLDTPLAVNRTKLPRTARQFLCECRMKDKVTIVLATRDCIHTKVKALKGLKKTSGPACWISCLISVINT